MLRPTIHLLLLIVFSLTWFSLTHGGRGEGPDEATGFTPLVPLAVTEDHRLCRRVPGRQASPSGTSSMIASRANMRPTAKVPTPLSTLISVSRWRLRDSSMSIGTTRQRLTRRSWFSATTRISAGDGAGNDRSRERAGRDDGGSV